MNTTHTPETLKAWQVDLGLSESGMAAYVGVPLHTWRKWLNGTRKPDAAPCSLLDLLALLPIECPALHALRLENAHKAAKPLKAAQVSPSRKKRASGSSDKPETPSDDAPPASPAPWVHVTEAVPEWMISAA